MSGPLRSEIIKHWQSFKNPLINDILINLEKLEKAHPKLTEEQEQKVSALLKAIQTSKPEGLDEMQFINVMNQLPAAHMLYIIHKLQTTNPDVMMKLINYAQKHKADNPDVEAFFQRNMVFEKSQLLGRIFSNHRMETVLGVLNEEGAN